MLTSRRGMIEMTGMIDSHTARLVRAVCILSASLAAAIILAADVHAQTAISQGSVASSASAPKPQAPAKPRWSELSPAQKQALAPLESEWDNLDAFRKNKWLVIGNKFASMKPDEQQRVQDRMRDWVRLTPEQRRMARENYLRAQKKLKPDQKSAQWEQYQQLPEEEKKKLAAEAAAKKHVATLPSPAQRKDSKTVPPIKSAPKPVLEQSVTPQATSQSALQPAVQPNK